MFEAFVMLCSLEATDVCRAALLPGHASIDRVECELSALMAEIGFEGVIVSGGVYCKERPASALEFEEVAPGVFVHTGAVAEPGLNNQGDTSNIGFVVGEDAIAVIDAGGTRALGEAVYLAIREVSQKPIRYAILTHMHPDHVFGAVPLQEAGAKVIAHQRLPRALADRSQTYLDRYADLIAEVDFMGTEVPVVDAVVEFETSIDLGGRTLDLVPRETAHTTNDMTVFDSETRLLFSGDLVVENHIPTLDGSLRGWISVLQVMCEERADGVVPGHGKAVLFWPESVVPMLSYLEGLVRDARAEIEAGTSLAEAIERIGMDQADRWSLFDVYNPRNATVAYTELEWE
ncbi:quinoprotein relay system zinc metallohydrolase 2 [Amaricoccus macauensis]|uniref:quinoprotein relay system zinc metallohydrolase 2 n=1 Tax=Amaricoccus macauensis TaxID=57001 RepID=UPI003C7A1AEC